MSNPNSKGLLYAMMSEKPKKCSERPKEQRGGDDSYLAHRTQAPKNLQTKKQLEWENEARTGVDKRNIWLAEVRNIVAVDGLNWSAALEEASRRRKAKIDGYQTVKERTKSSYTGRQATNVQCAPGKRCPGKYTKDPAKDPVTGERVYRPNAHKGKHVHLTIDAAKNILRDYYKDRAATGAVKGGLKGATRAMRQDISRKRHRNKVQSPCPTRLITVNKKDGTSHQRRIVDRTHPDFAECRSNWLYRSTPGRFDMKTLDYGNGPDSDGQLSPAYGKYTLPKTRSDKKKQPNTAGAR